MAGVSSPPCTDRLKMVLCPVLLCRIRLISLGLTDTATADPPEPYSTAGARPFTRKRRASFLPRVERASAATVISFLIFYSGSSR